MFPFCSIKENSALGQAEAVTETSLRNKANFTFSGLSKYTTKEYTERKLKRQICLNTETNSLI